MPCRSASALAATLVAALTLAVLAAPASAGYTNTTVGSKQVTATFAEPPASGSPADRTILDHLHWLIASTPGGQTIVAAVHSISDPAIIQALDDAQTRGVIVNIVRSGHAHYPARDSNGDFRPYRSSDPLYQALGSGSHRWCDHGADGAKGWGCISTDDSGTMHSKFFLFSQTAGQNHVTWVGSANLTGSTGAEATNNGITFWNATDVYSNLYWKVAAHMWNEASFAGNDFYAPPQGYWSSPEANLSVYASPEQSSDLVENRLDDVAPSSDCLVLVQHNMLLDSRPAVIDRLVSRRDTNGDGLADANGCGLLVIVGWNTDTNAPRIGEDALRRLKRVGAQVRTRQHMHDKTILTYSRYAGSSAMRYQVMAGSHNITYSALRENDELLIRVADAPELWSAYHGHFMNAWYSSTPV